MDGVYCAPINYDLFSDSSDSDSSSESDSSEFYSNSDRNGTVNGHKRRKLNHDENQNQKKNRIFATVLLNSLNKNKSINSDPADIVFSIKSYSIEDRTGHIRVVQTIDGQQFVVLKDVYQFAQLQNYRTSAKRRKCEKKHFIIDGKQLLCMPITDTFNMINRSVAAKNLDLIKEILIYASENTDTLSNGAISEEEELIKQRNQKIIHLPVYEKQQDPTFDKFKHMVNALSYSAWAKTLECERIQLFRIISSMYEK